MMQNRDAGGAAEGWTGGLHAGEGGMMYVQGAGAAGYVPGAGIRGGYAGWSIGYGYM